MKVLYAEDEQALSMAVAEILKMEGYEVHAVHDGDAASSALESGFFDIVVLDVMMPGKDGFEVLASMREKGIMTPVLMLTAKASIEDRVNGLGLGADDYLGKPFEMKELVARIDALTRRSGGYKHETIEFAGVKVDGSSCEVSTVAGSLRLNNREVEMLVFFAKNPNIAFTPAELNERAWNGEYDADKAEMYVFYLRNKLRQIRAEATFTEVEGKYLLEVGA